MKNYKLFKSTILITACSIITIVLGFFIQLIIAYYFGTKFERDSYFIASIIPTYIIALFSGSMGYVFLPKVVELIQSKTDEELNQFLSTTLILISSTVLFLVIVGMLFSTEIVGLIASNYTSQQKVFTANILIIILPSIVFNVLGNLLSSLYQIKHNFIRPAIAPILSLLLNLTLVISLSKTKGIMSLAIGMLAGSILSFVYLLPVFRIFKLQIDINTKNKDLVAFFRSMLPLFVTGIIFRSTTILERKMAANLVLGSISILGYSGQILSIMATITASGIAISTFPIMSRLWAERRINELGEYFIKVIRIILLISIPITVVILMYGSIIIKIIFERGAFTSESTEGVRLALACAMGAFIAQSLGNTVSKIFYITNKTKLISMIAIAEIVIYWGTGIALSKIFSFVGLSISLSISSLINVVAAFYFINKKIFSINFHILLRFIFNILLITMMGFFTFYIVFIYGNWGINQNVFMLICLIGSTIIFFYGGNLIKLEEFIYIKSAIILFYSKVAANHNNPLVYRLSIKKKRRRDVRKN